MVTDAVLGLGMAGVGHTLGIHKLGPDRDALIAVVVGGRRGVIPLVSCCVQGRVGQEGPYGAEMQPLGSLVLRSVQLTAVMFAQCRTVKISILGDEGVPVQVDGEAWIQPPGYIRIIHKNRAQTLTRDRVSEKGCLRGPGESRPVPGLSCGHACVPPRRRPGVSSVLF